MKVARVLCFAFALALLAGAILLAQGQSGQQRVGIEPPDIKLPDGRSQREEILKADHKRSLEDVNEILKLAGELRSELERNEHLVVSVKSVRQAEDIEKLAKKIRGRLKRH